MTKVEQLPKILIIQLLGFEVKRGRLSKINTTMDVPTNLDMAPWCTDETGISKTLNGLHAVIYYQGILEAGHYTAYIREANRVMRTNDNEKPELLSDWPESSSHLNPYI